MRPSPYTTHETIPLSQTVRVEDVRQKPDFWGGIWVVVLELQKQSEHTYLQTTIQTLPPDNHSFPFLRLIQTKSAYINVVVDRRRSNPRRRVLVKVPQIAEETLS